MPRRRPGFLHVSFGDDNRLQTMQHEKTMVREKDVKFDGDDGSIQLTDVRLVWKKKPSRWGKLKKVGGVAGAIAGAAALSAIGSEVGGLGGRALRRFGRGMGAAAVLGAVASWNRDSYINTDEDGNTDSVAVPVIAIAQAQQSGDELVVELQSGGAMRFDFKQKGVIPTIIANIRGAKQKGKCPYCGAGTGGKLKCPQCGAPLQPGAESSEAATSGDVAGYCSDCGEPYSQGDKFCGKCGSPL
ncbi:MAG: zinc ribbon domain-containing protein [Promethearchaeia archaeon]